MKYSCGHVCYYVRNMEESLDFYIHKMGFSYMFEQVFPGTEMKAVYVRIAPGQFLELIGNIPHEDKPKQSFSHLCLHVDDLQAAWEDLKAKGLNPSEVSAGQAHLLKSYLDDPDGNTLELMQLFEDSPQTVHDHD